MAQRMQIWRRAVPGAVLRVFRVLRHPASLVFMGLWAVSLGYLAYAGHLGFVWIALGTAGTTVALMLVTVVLMAGKEWTPPQRHEPAEPRRCLYVQLAFLGLIIVYTLLASFSYQHVAGPGSLAAVLGGPLAGLPNVIRNPLLFALVPLGGLLLLRARFKNLGLGQDRTLGILGVLWCAVPVLKILWQLGSGTMAIGTVGSLIFLNLVQNGFYEEFLFRGGAPDPSGPAV